MLFRAFSAGKKLIGARDLGRCPRLLNCAPSALKLAAELGCVMKRSHDFSKAVQNPYLKRIIVSVKIENVRDTSKSFTCDGLVDTNASLMVLPAAWKDRLGDLEPTRIIELETGTQGKLKGEVYGPVRIQIDGFRPIFNEVAFVEMKPADGWYEPLIGYIVLEQSQAAVDMLGHRLVPAKHMDLKSLICARASCFGNYSELPR